MTRAPFLLRVVATGRALLGPIAPQDGRIQIQGQRGRSHLLPQPVLPMSRDGLIGALAKPPEESREGGHGGHPCPAKDLAQGGIKAHQSGMRNVHAANPHGHQKTLQHESRRIAAIRQGVGQRTSGQHLPKVQPREKLLHQPSPPQAVTALSVKTHGNPEDGRTVVFR